VPATVLKVTGTNGERVATLLTWPQDIDGKLIDLQVLSMMPETDDEMLVVGFAFDLKDQSIEEIGWRVSSVTEEKKPNLADDT